ncbi:MAG: DUF4830 domain-containing protein [Ruminococcaceae bacterium]|nr:DUF4830 domain-containing protein [Oscillospiraceae bacterium]
MFIYSLRASTLKFFAVICVALATLITLIAFVPAYGEGSTAVSGDLKIKYDGVKTNEDRIAFLRQFGWEVQTEPKESVEVTIPAEFDKIFTGYNEIQKRQGLDLSDYKKKKVMRYTYEVTNYEGANGTVYANILVYRNKVIGGDVCSADVTGFIHGFEK